MTSQTYDEQAAGVIDALRAAVHRDHRRRRRRRRALAATAAVFVLTGSAVAATHDWWTNAPAATDQPVVDFQLAPTRYPDGHTELLADPKNVRTVARTAGATLIAAPSARGSGYCVLPQLPRAAGESAAAAALGFGCVGRAVSGDGGGSVFGTFTGVSGGDAVWFAYGRITDAGAIAVDLSDAAGAPLRAALGHGGFFITPLLRSAWERLDDRWDEIAILGSDGAIIRRTCVPFSPAPFSRVDGPEGGGGLASAENDEHCTHEGPIPQSPPQPVEATPAPPLTGTDILTAAQVDLRDLAGTPVVLEFWNSVCTNETAARHGCQDTTLFELQALARSRRDVAVLSVAVRDRLTAAERDSLPTGYSHVRDPNRELAAAWGITEFPTLLFLDKDHRLRARIVGIPSEPEIMRAVRMASP
jgi:hypothetical protein